MTDVVKKEVSPPENWVECKMEVKTEPVDERAGTSSSINLMKAEVKKKSYDSESNCVEVKEESSDSESSSLDSLSSEDDVPPKRKKKPAGKRRRLAIIACKFCRYKTNQRKDMAIHNYGHDKEKPCKCTVCGFATVGTDNLNMHMLLTHGDTNISFTCKLCGYRAYRKGLLRAHMYNHSLENPSKCTACDYSTKRKYNLARHLLVWHSQDERLKCKFCGFRTSCPNRLKKHHLVHTKRKYRCTYTRCACTKPCGCPPCDFAANRRRAFRKHVEMWHSAGERKHNYDPRDYKWYAKSPGNSHPRTSQS